MKSNNEAPGKVLINPFVLLIVILASIFSAEALVMLFLSILSPLSISINRYAFFLDSGMLVLILFPVIYSLVFKPFSSQIEELKRSREALLESEEKCRSIVETTDDSIYLVDSSYRYLFMNRKHMARIGFTGGEYMGRCFSEFHSDEATRDFIEKVDTVFEKAKPAQHGYQSDEDHNYYLRTFSPIIGPDGKVKAVSVVSKKISPR